MIQSPDAFFGRALDPSKEQRSMSITKKNVAKGILNRRFSGERNNDHESRSKVLQNKPRDG